MPATVPVESYEQVRALDDADLITLAEDLTHEVTDDSDDLSLRHYRRLFIEAGTYTDAQIETEIAAIQASVARGAA